MVCVPSMVAHAVPRPGTKKDVVLMYRDTVLVRPQLPVHCVFLFCCCLDSLQHIPHHPVVEHFDFLPLGAGPHRQ